MKIAIIFPRLSGPYGGEKILIKVANGLIRLGHKVTLYVYEYNALCAAYLNPEIQVVRSRALRFGRHNLDTLLAYLAMPFLANKIPCDYELVLGMTWQAAFALWWLRKVRRCFHKIPLVYHCFEPPRFIYDLQTITGNSPLARLVAFFVKRIDHASVRASDVIISISDNIQAQVKKIYNRNSVKVYPGVEVKRFQRYTRAEAREILNIPLEQEIFLSISKLHKRKRLDQALDIFQKRRRDQNSIFYIAGQGPEEENLERLVKEKHLERSVRFIGMILGKKTVQYMAACDYFIFTALNEPFGIAPLEAKVAGAKVIPEERPYPILTWQESVGKMHNLFLKLLK